MRRGRARGRARAARAREAGSPAHPGHFGRSVPGRRGFESVSSSEVLRAIMLYRHFTRTALNWPLKSDFLEILDGDLRSRGRAYNAIFNMLDALL